MSVRQIRPIRTMGKWGLPLAGVAAVAILWGFTTRVQGAEQTVSTYQGTAVVAVKTAPAREGQIATSLAYTAEVKATSQVTVLPKASGRIERMLVDVGSPVRQGDPLAELEAEALKVQVAQAKANLASVQARLSSMESGPRREQVAQAWAALESAQARHDTVKKGANEADVQAAQSAVDSARANLQIAQARLESLKIGPTQAEWVAAEASVNSARANWNAAQAYLDEVKAGPKPSELQAAQNAVDAALSALYAANDRVQIWKGSDPDTVKLATGATSTSQAVKSSEAAQSAYNAALEKLNLLKSKPLPVELRDAESRAEAAKAAYESAAAKLEQMKKGPAAQDLQQAEGAVAAAEAALASAEARLKQLQDGPTAEDLTVAEGALTQAQQQYSLAANPYTKHDLEMARAQVAQAQAAVDLAELALKESVVTSPVDGVVAERFQTAGNLVSPQTPIVSVVSEGVELLLGVEEDRIGQLREGQKAEITVGAYPDVTFPAAVAVVSPTVDPKTRTFLVKVRPEDPEGRLRPGMFAQTRIVTEEKGGAVLVPKEAVVSRSGESVVFVLKGEVAEMRPVKVGLAHNGTVEIADGLEAGEEVVVAGQQELRDGDTVRKS
ncbi:MAG: efflux RND transporter periplasmic adaptor subunit [Sphingomonadaceae bacterium]